MAFEIKGKVVHVGKAQQVTEKLKKRILVVEYADNPTYPEQIQFEAVNDRCASLDELREGDEVGVHFNLKGRSYTDKKGDKAWFNSLGIWKVDVLKTAAPQQAGYKPSKLPEDESDMPF